MAHLGDRAGTVVAQAVDHHRGAARVQAGPDGQDLLAFDQHVGLREVADLRVHRHDRAATDEIAPAASAAVFGLPVFVGCGRASRQQIECRGREPRHRRGLQEIAARTGVVLRAAFVTESAHVVSPPAKWPFARRATALRAFWN